MQLIRKIVRSNGRPFSSKIIFNCPFPTQSKSKRRPLTNYMYEYFRTDRWEAGSLWISSYRGRFDSTPLYSSTRHPVIFWVNLIDTFLRVLLGIHIINRPNGT